MQRVISNTQNPSLSADVRRWALASLALAVVASTPAMATAEEMSGPGLDDSYNVAELRPQYKACIAASDAVMPEIQACQEQEFAYQQGRMRAALNRIDAGPDSYFKDEVMNWQAEYMRHTDTNCRDQEEQGPEGEGRSCFINRFANRASALEALAQLAERGAAKP